MAIKKNKRQPISYSKTLTMLSIISAIIAGTISGIVVTKYKHNLQQNTKKESIVIVKNVNEFSNILTQEVSAIEDINEADNLSTYSRREYIRINIPVPYQEEVNNFFSKSLAFIFGFTLMASFIFLLLSNGEGGIAEFSIYTYIALFVFIIYKIFLFLNRPFIATIIRILVISISNKQLCWLEKGG